MCGIDERSAIADQSSGRNQISDAGIRTIVLHVLKHAFSLVQHADHRSGIFIRNIADNFFDRLAGLTINLLQNDFRSGNSYFVSFPAHLLQKNRQMKLTAAGDLEGIGRSGFFYFKTDIDFEFLFKTLADIAGSHIFASLSGERRIIDHKIHGQRRFFDLDHRQRIHRPIRAKRISD